MTNKRRGYAVLSRLEATDIYAIMGLIAATVLCVLSA